MTGRDEQLAALARLQLDWVVDPDDVWSPLTQHVSALHAGQARQVLDRFAQTERTSTPLGVVLEGEKGVGKTHMLRRLREDVQAGGGWFFLVKFLEGGEFWHSVLHGVVAGFHAGGSDQLTRLLHRLCDLAQVEDLSRMKLCGMIPVTRADLDVLVDGLLDAAHEVAVTCEDTIRALALYRARKVAGEAGRSYFAHDGEVDTEQRVAWGLRHGARPPQQILGELFRVLALTGPTLVAVDQLDSLMAQANASGDGSSGLVAQVADGLMELRGQTRRALVVVACLPRTWQLITTRAVSTAADRFTVTQLRGALPSADVAADLVRLRLDSSYAESGFVPPHPTWPVRPEAFRTTAHHTPRRLLRNVAEHVRRCVEAGEPTELSSFGDEAQAPQPHRTGEEQAFTALDAEFDALRATADVTAALTPATEDDVVPRLLAAALKAFVLELGERGRDLSLDPLPGARPALHARLRRTLDEVTDDEQHWAFRAVASTHPNAVLSRLRNARTEAGLREDSDRRRLILLRNTPMSAGKATTRTIEALEALGAIITVLGDDDIRTFAALQTLVEQAPAGLGMWLTKRRPASGTELFGKVFTDLPSTAAPADPAPAAPPADHHAVPLGRTADGRLVTVPLPALRQHTVVFAGSGSGKTVLLRRLVEECALRGVSSIVLDPNSDLARLGDPWPESPPREPGDEERAREYQSTVEVVVWTPRKQQGRPLVLRPLPDFAGVRDNPEELAQAVEAAVAGLLPRVALPSSRAAQGRAVLQQALTHHASTGVGDLDSYLNLLADLPDGVSDLRDARRLAADMSDKLRAATIVDPLFGGSGNPLDPAELLTPEAGHRARISVISMIGLPDDSHRQTFVNQLQLALFSWIRRHPAGDRPLGGLLVMDEAQDFAPSDRFTPCTDSTLKLSAQARKYGLGLVFATQAPKGLHNRIAGNAATQVYGRTLSGVQINAITELARRRGGDVPDIARLTSGQFYAATDGTGIDLIRAPLCLSHHPPSPLTEEEVLDRARRRRSSREG